MKIRQTTEDFVAQIDREIIRDGELVLYAKSQKYVERDGRLWILDNRSRPMHRVPKSEEETARRRVTEAAHQLMQRKRQADNAVMGLAHLTFNGQLLCGCGNRALHRLPAAMIKQPLSRSLGQIGSLQRKLLQNRDLCPLCHKAIRSMAESLVARALAVDGALDIDHLMPG